MRALACMLALVALVVTIAAGPVRADRAPDVPRCPEDSMLVGSGTFEAGRWSAYVCGPAVDDVATR